jgi:hypothetical protein
MDRRKTGPTCTGFLLLSLAEQLYVSNFIRPCFKKFVALWAAGFDTSLQLKQNLFILFCLSSIETLVCKLYSILYTVPLCAAVWATYFPWRILCINTANEHAVPQKTIRTRTELLYMRRNRYGMSHSSADMMTQHYADWPCKAKLVPTVLRVLIKDTFSMRATRRCLLHTFVYCLYNSTNCSVLLCINCYWYEE